MLTREQLTAAHAAELAAIEHERSGVEGAMYARILALEAELAKKDAEIAALKAGMVGDYDLDAWLDWRMDRFNTKLVEAKEQGRRKALQGLPVDALIYATLLLRLEAGNIESVVSSKTVSTYERAISRLVESIRAAQQEETK